MLANNIVNSGSKLELASGRKRKASLISAGVSDNRSEAAKRTALNRASVAPVRASMISQIAFFLREMGLKGKLYCTLKMPQAPNEVCIT